MNDRFSIITKLCFGFVLSVLLLGAQPAGAQDTMRLTESSLPQFLQKMAEATEPGMRASEYVVIRDAKASGKTFVINYVVEVPDVELAPSDFDPEALKGEAKGMCDMANLQKLMKYGAIFERIYRNKQGGVLYTVKVDRERCKKLG